MSAIDIVVPCYNYGRYLAYCVESILSQEGIDLRVLIIDDCSTDDTPEIANKLCAHDHRVTFHRNSKNLGHIKTFNLGILDWAKAPYTLLISADDALTPGSLSRALAVLEKEPDTGMVYGIVRVIGSDDFPKVQASSSLTYRTIDGDDFIRHCFRVGNRVPSPTAVVRTELQQRTGGYRSQMIHTSDMEMWMRVATRSSIAVIREQQGLYRWHGANMTNQFTSGVLEDFRERLVTCEYVLTTSAAEMGLDYNNELNKMKYDLALQALWAAGNAGAVRNNKDFREAVKFAVELNHELRYSSAMVKTKLKKILGKTTVSYLISAAKYIGLRNTENKNSVEKMVEYGWWPS